MAGPLRLGIVIAPVLQNWFPFTTVWLFTVCVMEPLLLEIDRAVVVCGDVSATLCGKRGGAAACPLLTGTVLPPLHVKSFAGS